MVTPVFLAGAFDAVLVTLGGTPVTLGQVVVTLAGLLLLVFGMAPLTRGIKLFLKLFRMRPGSREAFGNLIAYALLLIGLFAYLRVLGINLTSLTVFASAVGLGIGFGLQKLVNNFFSGILLLLERPIQVGDNVDLEGLSGVVEGIAVRFTVLRTLDNNRILVPNAEFTEKRLVNYDYTDRRCRVRLPVHVAIDAVPVRVTEALIAAARQEPAVLATPRPEVFLEAIEPRQMRFMLSVWVENADSLYRVRSNLNFRMAEALEAYHVPRPAQEMNVHLQRSPAAAEVGRVFLGDLLQHLDLFSSFGHAQLSRLIELGSTRAWPAGEIVFRRGDPGNSMCLILKGRVEVLGADESTRIATLGHGQFFGEMALLLGTPRTATIRALEPSEFFEIDEADLKLFMAQWPSLEERISQALKTREQELRGLGQMPELPENRSLVQQFRERVRLWLSTP